MACGEIAGKLPVMIAGIFSGSAVKRVCPPGNILAVTLLHVHFRRSRPNSKHGNNVLSYISALS